MKKVLALVAMLAISATASAGDSVSDNEFCGAVGRLAAITIEARHSGVSMQAMIDDIANTDSDFIKKVKERMIIDAFEHPRLDTPEIRRRSIDEFKNRWYLDCYRARKTSKK